MGWGAGIGGSRPAAVGAARRWAWRCWPGRCWSTCPVTDETGALGSSFEGARGQAGTGLTLEIVAGLLAIAGGGLALRLPARE